MHMKTTYDKNHACNRFLKTVYDNIVDGQYNESGNDINVLYEEISKSKSGQNRGYMF
jgi:hypothetical protein